MAIGHLTPNETIRGGLPIVVKQPAALWSGLLNQVKPDLPATQVTYLASCECHIGFKSDPDILAPFRHELSYVQLEGVAGIVE
jgi:hypothetical protein